MSARWVFVILACCRLSHASQPQASRACYDRLTTVCVSAGENVYVPCPNTVGEVVTYNLFQNEDLVYNQTCNPGACTAQYTSTVGLQENTENKSVSFVLSVVNASSHYVYRCERKVSFPPPFKTEPSDLILVLVEGHHCNITTETPVRTVQYCGFYWILIVAIVSLYSVIATVIAIFNWVKLRRTDSQSDYMNTKPKPARDRRKKRGVQNGFPRHF
ncbi:uncharacterized protein AB9X84_004897 [Acanthopagrus schlegelii]